MILKSIIALAHDLGMDVVAEGAETDSDAVELYQLGCEYAQGFAFGEPMDADAAMRLLTEVRLEAASYVFSAAIVGWVKGAALRRLSAIDSSTGTQMVGTLSLCPPLRQWSDGERPLRHCAAGHSSAS